MMRLIKICVLFLVILVLSVDSFAQPENTAIQEPEVGADNTAEADKDEFDVRKYRDPFKTWLPKAILDRIPGRISEITRITEEDEEEEEGDIAEFIALEDIIPPEVTIKGLIWNTDSPQAIVNDTIVSIGDDIEGAEITGIVKEGITINYMGRDFFIKPKLSIAGSEGLY